MGEVVKTIGKLSTPSAEFVIRYFTFNILAQQWGIRLVRDLNDLGVSVTPVHLRALFTTLRSEDQRCNGSMPEVMATEALSKH